MFIKGKPIQQGFYWSRLLCEKDLVMVAELKNGMMWDYGHYGGGYVDEEAIKYYEYMPIKMPTPDAEWKWQNFNDEHIYCWAKDREGYVGFCLLKNNWNNTFTGTIIYLNHPTCGASHGEYFCKEEGWVFTKTELWCKD